MQHDCILAENCCNHMTVWRGTAKSPQILAENKIVMLVEIRRYEKGHVLLKVLISVILHKLIGIVVNCR